MGCGGAGRGVDAVRLLRRPRPAEDAAKPDSVCDRKANRDDARDERPCRDCTIMVRLAASSDD
jgi:hypothetical protein